MTHTGPIYEAENDLNVHLLTVLVLAERKQKLKLSLFHEAEEIQEGNLFA